MLEYWYIERGLLLPVRGELKPRTKTGILEPLRGGIYNFLRSDKQPSPFYLILLGLNHLLWKEDSVTQIIIENVFTSVNSISSIPSPVYQCKKALRLNMAVNCSPIRLNSSWMAVLLPMKVEDILSPRGGMSQTAVLTLLGIHSTK